MSVVQMRMQLFKPGCSSKLLVGLLKRTCPRLPPCSLDQQLPRSLSTEAAVGEIQNLYQWHDSEASGSECVPCEPPGSIWECLGLGWYMICMFNQQRKLFRIITWENTSDKLGNPAKRKVRLDKKIRMTVMSCFALSPGCGGVSSSQQEVGVHFREAGCLQMLFLCS